MKKLLVLIGLTTSVLFASHAVVNAEETTTTEPVEQTTTIELPDAGVKPGDLFYGVDKFFENVAIKLTFSDEKKAEKLSQIAEERLAELNELDEEKAAVYADELFNEYGLSLEKANLFVQQLVAEGKISEEKLAKLEARVAKAEERQARLNEKAKEKISSEVKERVQENLKNAKMSIFSKFEDVEAINNLHDQGYGYGQLLRLQAIASLSSKTIDELLTIENVVITNEENEKEINFELLLETLNLTNEQVKDQLVEYKDTARNSMKGKMGEANDRATERREEIKDSMKGKSNR